MSVCCFSPEMTSIRKVREGLFCISWVNQCYTPYNQVDINFKEIFQSCKLAYRVTGNQVHFDVEAILSPTKKTLNVEIVAIKNGVKLLMKFVDNKWRATFNTISRCCANGLLFDIVLDFTPDSTILMKKESKRVLDYMLNLWTKKTLSDVTFLCNRKNIEAHTLIVASGSPVLAALFQKEDNSRKRIVEIKETKSEVFEQLLRYIYTGEMDVEEVDVLAEIMVAADKYGVDSLKEECASRLSQNLSVENASQYLILAHVHNSSHLHQSALDFMSHNAKAICSRKDWMEIIKNYPELSFAAMQLMTMNC